MKNLIYTFLVVVSLVSLNSCSSDFDVIGSYEETTIVYGLLDQSEDLHFIKINKSFLGPGDANIYATIRDSSEYANVDGKVEEWINGVKQREWILQDTVLTDRESGLFYYPEQTVYYFIEPNLVNTAEYRLVLDINEGQKEVTASTYLVDDFNFTYAPNTNTTSPIGFAVPNALGEPTYSTYPVKWTSSANGKRYDLVFRFKYDEYTATDTTRKYIDWFIGSVDVPDNSVALGGFPIEKGANGQNFYNKVAANVSTDPLVLKRVIRGIDIMVASASEVLNTYMIVNAPSNGLIQERPQFTNVNNGIGIFSSRYNKAIVGKVLNKNSIEILCNGSITGHLGFCSDTIIYSAESFYCQ